MKGWIEVTGKDESKTLINISHIVHIEDNSINFQSYAVTSGSYWWLTVEHIDPNFECKETYQELKRLIQEASE
jgi:hypothetical protein